VHIKLLINIFPKRRRYSSAQIHSQTVPFLLTVNSHSAASTADRLGFQHLVASVGLGRVGLVLGLEVSRLARNSSDWHHLLEMCALTHTLILDEEGLYDPSTFNNRLLYWIQKAGHNDA
jgi:DNA invertase Pin-like site-specific DNA recombinase